MFAPGHGWRPAATSTGRRPDPSGRDDVRVPGSSSGAGCAGLSLAWNLVERGVREPILLIDRRETVRERPDLVLLGRGADAVLRPRHPRLDALDGPRRPPRDGGQLAPNIATCRVRSADVYRRVLDGLAKAPGVDDGARVGRSWASRESRRGGARSPRRSAISPASGRSTARRAGPPIVGVGPGRRPAGAAPALLRPDDPGRPPDVRPVLPDPDGLPGLAAPTGPHFVYLLPLSATEALVENTYLFPFAISADRHRARDRRLPRGGGTG